MASGHPRDGLGTITILSSFGMWPFIWPRNLAAQWSVRRGCHSRVVCQKSKRGEGLHLPMHCAGPDEDSLDQMRQPRAIFFGAIRPMAPCRLSASSVYLRCDKILGSDTLLV